jgi:hypothetical protein
MQTGPIRDVQLTKKCVYSIPCDCGRCYIGERSRHLEVCIKEHKYTQTQVLLEKSKLAQHAYKEAKVLQIEPNATYRKYKEFGHMSLGCSSDQSTQLGHLSHLDSHYCRNQKTTTSSSVDYGRLFFFYVGTIQRICLYSVGFYFDSILIL